MQEIQCDLCGARHYQVVYKSPTGSGAQARENYRISENVFSCPEIIIRCLNCGLVFVPSREESETLTRSYQEMVDKKYVEEEAGRRLTAKSVLKKLAKYRKFGARILDLGCGPGFFLDEARKAGWEAHGVELSKWAVDYARGTLGLKVHNGVLDQAGFPHKFFDVVTLHDTIEHLLEPKETLIAIRKILKPTGIIYLNTPDIESLASRVLKARWWGINRYHLFYFSKTTLSRMLKAAGFETIQWSSYTRIFTCAYWLWRFKSYNRFLYGIMAFFCRVGHLDNKFIKVNFFDQIEVVARRRRSLEYLDEIESAAASVEAKKMKTVVVLPAFNAAKTLSATYQAIPKDIVDEIILVDDASSDDTVKIAEKLGMRVYVHERNRGYGANQKTCYEKALESRADIIVMVHPDYQYDPRAIPDMVALIKEGKAEAVFGSRMMKGGALIGGMPLWKHNVNILLSAIANIILGTYLSEYHSGFRAYSAKFLNAVNFKMNSDNFVFDFEIIVQGILHYCRIDEVPIRTRYFDEASSIKFFPSLIYGLSILKTLVKFCLHNAGLVRFKQFE